MKILIIVILFMTTRIANAEWIYDYRPGETIVDALTDEIKVVIPDEFMAGNIGEVVGYKDVKMVFGYGCYNRMVSIGFSFLTDSNEQLPFENVPYVKYRFDKEPAKEIDRKSMNLLDGNLKIIDNIVLLEEEKLQYWIKKLSKHNSLLFRIYPKVYEDYFDVKIDLAGAKAAIDKVNVNCFNAE